MIETIIVGTSTIIVLCIFAVAMVKAVGLRPADLSKHKMTAADLSAPPPWAAPQFRCPNCSCKWCKFGAKND